MMLIYFKEQLHDQPWCQQDQRLPSPEYAQVDGAIFPMAPIATTVLSEGNIPLRDNIAYGLTGKKHKK